MKRPLIYAGIALAAGLLLGYLIFAPETADPGSTHDHQAEESRTVQWTCSMHPQILQPEPGKCPICGMDLIPAEAGQEGLAPGQFRLTENALALADIRTTRLGGEGGSGQAMRLSGTLRANEKTLATQSAYYDGRIERLLVNYEGESVRKGQQLATLYAPELVAAQQELLTAASLKQSQPELYEAVRSKLALWKLSEAQISAIEASGKVMEYFPIYSDVTGTVSQIAVAAGDYVKKGSPLFKIADLSTVWAEFDAYENQLARIREGQAIVVRAQALPEKEFQAQVSFVSPVLNPATRTATVRAVLPNAGGALRPGMFVSGSLQAGAKEQASTLMVPESAVMWTGKRSVVYVKPDPAHPVFEMREVTLGALLDGGYQVLSGLQGGEEVVTNGTFTLDAAAQLKGSRSMMNPSSTAAGFSLDETIDFAQLVGLYLPVKDALVDSDADTARDAARKASQSLSELAGAGQLQPLIEQFESLAGARELAQLREEFRHLSDLLIQTGAGNGHFDQTLYVQYCPMANSNRGATWLSQQAEIRNPYFGDAMLSCGETRATWPAR